MRQLTLSTDKDKYGIRLRAEPDHMVLGKKLKAAFKAITASIKELTSEQLEVFQKTGISMSFCAPDVDFCSVTANEQEWFSHSFMRSRLKT